jgi:hypothetical protein
MEQVGRKKNGLVRIAAIMLALACGCSGARAGEAPIRIGMQAVIAPFVLPEQDSGLFVDVLRAAFSSQHLVTQFIYLPDVRFENQFSTAAVDVSTVTGPGASQLGYLSHWPVSHFHNMAITLRSRIPELNSLNELRKYRVTAFRNASKVLGPDYNAALAGQRNYEETPTMPSAALLLGRTDVIISQPDVFLYYLRRQSSAPHSQEEGLAYHDVLGPGRLYWMQFRTEAQRSAFERGIAQLYASGEIDRILLRYQQEYGVTRDFLLPLDCQFRPTLAPLKCRHLGLPRADQVTSN